MSSNEVFVVESEKLGFDSVWAIESNALIRKKVLDTKGVGTVAYYKTIIGDLIVHSDNYVENLIKKLDKMEKV